MQTLARTRAWAWAWLLLLLLASACRASAHRSAAPPPPPRWIVHADDAATPAAERGWLSTAGRDLAHGPRRLWDDGKLVFASGRNWLYLALATAYSFAAETFEDREAVFFENHTIYADRVQRFLGALGNGLTLYAGALTWYFATQDEGGRHYESSKTVLSAMTVTSITTLALKAVVTDTRPNGGSHDFPSGHASLSMSIAASLDELYGHAVGFPAYGLSALIGIQRLDVGKHDTGSVVFGWVLGYVVGATVAGHHAPRILGMDVGFEVDAETGAPSLVLSRTL